MKLRAKCRASVMTKTGLFIRSLGTSCWTMLLQKWDIGNMIFSLFRDGRAAVNLCADNLLTGSQMKRAS